MDDWMRIRAPKVLSQEVRNLLKVGGRHKACDCQGSASCRDTGMYLIGTMIAAGFSLREVRRMMLDGRNKGAAYVWTADDPVTTFLEMWEWCNREDEAVKEERTEEDRTALVLALCEVRPGIGTNELRKTASMRTNVLSALVGGLVESGHLRQEREGQRVCHYRTGLPYGPLDEVRMLEHLRMYLPHVNYLTAEEIDWLLSHEKTQGLRANYAERLARYVSTGQVFTRDRFSAVYDITTDKLNTLKEAHRRSFEDSESVPII